MSTTALSLAHTQRGHRHKASPRARRALTRHGLTAGSVRGSGPRERIVEADVLALAEARKHAAPESAKVAPFQNAMEYLGVEIDATNLLLLRTQFLPYAKKQGCVFSIGDMLLHALRETMRDVPGLEGGITLQTADSSPALSLTQSGRVSLLDLARWRQQEAGGVESDESAAVAFFDGTAGRIDDWQPSMPGGCRLALAAGRVAKRVIAANDEVALRPTTRLTLAFDISAVQRTVAVELMQGFAVLLEEPEGLIFS